MKKSVRYLKIFANLLVAVLGIVVVFYFGPRLLLFFMPFVVGYLISLIANPLVRFFEKRLKIVRKHGSIIIIVGVLALVILLLYLGVAKLGAETAQLIENLPQIYDNFAADFHEIGENLSVVVSKLPVEVQRSISSFTSNLSMYLGGLVQAVGQPTFEAAGNFAKNVPGTLIAIIMGILSAYFFTAERDKLVEGVKRYTPAGILGSLRMVLGDLRHVVGGYFKAQLKIMVVVYLILVIGLLILRVDYVLLVGFLIAFLDMLPFFGTGTVLGPWAIIKILSGDYKMAIGLIVLYAVTQVVRQVIQPKIVGDSIGMNPLLTLLFMFIGYKFYSVIGMIVAVPAGMIFLNLIKAGLFDTQIRCIRELVKDFNEFRRMDDEEEKEET